jgi:hypothetical protein
MRIPTRVQAPAAAVAKRIGVVAAASIATLGALAPVAAADAVYHTAHMQLAAVGDEPLRSGFVQNIKANGPTIYAHEVYVLNGAAPRATYTVTNNFFFEDPTCDNADSNFASDTAQLRTNRAGNARADIFVVPADAAGFEGVHGVMWTIQNAAGEVVYQTGCSTVTLD